MKKIYYSTTIGIKTISAKNSCYSRLQQYFSCSTFLENILHMKYYILFYERNTYYRRTVIKNNCLN